MQAVLIGPPCPLIDITGGESSQGGIRQWNMRLLPIYAQFGLVLSCVSLKWVPGSESEGGVGI